jgi:hypothetical protein
MNGIRSYLASTDAVPVPRRHLSTRRATHRGRPTLSHDERPLASGIAGGEHTAPPESGKLRQLRPQEIVRIAQARLRGSAYAPVRQVICRYDAGSLILAGRLPSFFHKQLAQEAVAHIHPGVRVINQTEVIELKARCMPPRTVAAARVSQVVAAVWGAGSVPSQSF